MACLSTEVTAGAFDYWRGVGGMSQRLSGQTELLVGAEIQRYDGPWGLDQDLKKLNGLAKLIHNTRNTESVSDLSMMI